MTTPLAAPAARTCPHTPARTLGADLHPGSIVVDAAGHQHRIDGFKPYPGRFIGDDARVAYGDHWERTIPDHKPFHALPDH
jgi:hypothetical protein